MSVNSGWGRFTWGQAEWNEDTTLKTGWGATLTRSGVGLTGTTAFTDFGDVTYSSASFTANGAMIYNTTTGTGSSTTDSVAIIAFGGDKTASNGTFKIEFPANDATAAIIRLAQEADHVGKLRMGTVHLGPS